MLPFLIRVRLFYVNVKDVNFFPSGAKPIIHAMKRHNRRVTCLLHPYSDVASYDPKLLVSGSSDFTVNLWNLETGAWLYTFAVHGGGITKLFCCPQSGSVCYFILLLF